MHYQADEIFLLSSKLDGST